MNNRRNLVAKQMIPRTSGVNKYILGIRRKQYAARHHHNGNNEFSASNISVDLLSRDRKQIRRMVEFKNLSFEQNNRAIDFATDENKTPFSRGRRKIIKLDLFFHTRIYNCFQNNTRYEYSSS